MTAYNDLVKIYLQEYPFIHASSSNPPSPLWQYRLITDEADW